MQPKPVRLIHPAHRTISALLAALMTVFSVSPAFALPQGEQVRHGDVNFDRQGNDLIIRQMSPKAIVNYDAFSIGGAESVRFEQPGSGAAILNRVTGGASSTIAGAMLSNGHVYLINPNGILFSSSAQVDVGGLVASAMNLSDENFLAGRLSFSGGGGSVVNQGTINAGSAFLVGGRVENDGTIRAGNIVLGAGENSVVIDEVEGGQIRLIIDGQEQDPDAAGDAPATEGTTGVAAGETPAVTPSAPETPAAPVEAVEAVASVAQETAPAAAPETHPSLADQIRNDPLTKGLVYNKGILDASGIEGGRVDLGGKTVVQDGVVKADGTEGQGGTLNITAADLVVVTSSSQTSANAGMRGDGGSITVFSPGTAILESGAQASARGGSQSGNGGFAEVSGHAQVVVRGVVDLTADHGDAGTLLIDPLNVRIRAIVTPGTGGSFSGGTWTPSSSLSDIAIVDLLAQLVLGNVVIETDVVAGSEDGNITLVDILDLGASTAAFSRTLTLNALDNITFNGAIVDTSIGQDRLLNLVLNANTDNDAVGGVLLAAGVDTSGGSFSATGVSFGQSAGTIATGGGLVDLDMTGSVGLGGTAINTGGGGITIVGGGAGANFVSSTLDTDGGNISMVVGAGTLAVNGLVDASGGAGNGAVDLRSTGNILAVNALSVITSGGGGSVTLLGGTALNVSGDVVTNGGDAGLGVTGIGTLSLLGTGSVDATGGANNGAVDLQASDGNVFLAAGSQLSSGSAGNVSVNANGALRDVTMAGTVTAGSGAITVSANRDLTHTGSTTSGGGINQLGADMNFDGVGLGSFGGTITLNGSGVLNLRGGDTTISGIVDTNGNNGQFQARNNFTLSGDVLTDGGNVQLSASAGGAGNILITGTGLLDARGGANNGIATLSNGGGNITNDGEVRSGTAGRLFAQAGGATGVFTQNGTYVGGTEALFGTTVRANNGIVVNLPIIGTGSVNLFGNFDGLGGGDVELNASVTGDGGVTISGASVIGDPGVNITAQNNLIDIGSTSGNVDIFGAINSNGGGITVNAATTLAHGAGASGLSSGGGSIALVSGGSMQLSGPVTTSGGTFDADVTGAGVLSILNDITTSGGNVDITTANGVLLSSAGSDINVSGGAGTGSVRLESLSAAQSLLVGGAVTTGSGGANLRAGGDLTINAQVIGGGGNVQLRANSDGGVLGNLAVNAAVSTTGAGDITLRGVNFSQAGTGTIDASSGAVNGLFTGVSTISRAITSTSGLVTLDTTNDLNINAAVSGGGGVTLGGANIDGNGSGTVTAQNNLIEIIGGGAVDMIAAIDSNGGDITIGAGTLLDLGPGLVSSEGGVVTLSSVNAMTLTGPITTGGGAFNADVTGAGALAIQNDITTSGGNVDITTFNGLLSSTAGSDVDASGGAGTASIRLESLNAGQGLTIGSGITSGTGGANLRAGGNVTVNGVVNGGGGTVQLVANTDNGIAGDLAVNAGVSTAGSGDITLGGRNFTQSGTGTIGASGGNVDGTFATSANVSRSVTSTTGTVDLNAPAITLNAAVSGGGGVTLGGGSITGNAGGTVTAQNNDIQITGTGLVDIIDTIDSNGGDIIIGAGTTLDLGSGLISSDGGMITLSSVNAMNLVGPVTTSGGAFNADVTGTGALTIQNDITTSGGNVDITTFNGLLFTTAGSVIDASGGAGTSAVRLESLDGVQDLSVGDSVLAGSGGLTLRAGNHVTLEGTVTSSGATVLTADSNVGGVGMLSVNAPVQVNGTGTLTLRGRDFSQGAGGTLTTSGGFIDADFVNNYVIGQAVNSNGGAVTFLGSNGITVNAVVSSAPPSGGTGLLVLRGGVTLNAAPVVGNADVTLNGNGLDLIINTALALGSGADLGANRDVIINQPVSTTAGRSLFITADLNDAVDAATTRGGVLVQGAGSLTSGNHLVVKGAHINDAGGLGEAILLAGAANTLTSEGNLLVTDNASAPVGADVVIGGNVISNGGSVNVLSARNIAQQGGADIVSLGGDLLVNAGGDFTQGANSFAVVENGGNLFINAGGAITLESVRNFTGGRGDIAIQAVGDITPLNVGFFELRGDQVSLLSTGGAIGAAGNPLQVEANTVAIGAAGNVFVTAAGFPSLVFDEVPVLSVDALALNGTVSGSTGPGAPVATGTTAGGSFVATSQPGGDVTFDTSLSVTGGGVLVVDGGNVNFNEAVSTAGGSATIVAGNNVAFGANGSLSTSGGSVNLDPGAALTMASGSFVNSGNGNIRLDAADPSSLGLLDAGTGLISLSAGNLTDANGPAVNLIASAVRLRTVSGAIGASGNALELQTSLLAAESAGGLFLGNTGALTVGTVGQVGVNRVNALLAAVVDTDAAATSDVVSTGSLVLDASGALTLDDGILANGTAVQANSGSARLSSGGDITANAAATATGHLSVLADGNIAQNAGFSASGAASTLDVQAGGSITMLDAVIGSTGGGNLRYNAQGGDLTFAGLTAAGSGNLSLLASGSILGTATGLLTGNAARLEAGTGVGSQVLFSANQVQLQVGTLAGLAGAGGISVSDQDSLVIGSVGPLSVNRVGLSGALTTESDTLLSGLDTSAGGNIFAYAAAGSLTVDQAVTADGSGVAVLGASGAASDLTLNAAVNSGTGDVVLGAGRDLVINSVTAGTGGSGAIQASANRSIVMNGTARLSNTSGDMVLTAGDGILLGEVFSTSGNVIASASGAAGITDANGAALNLRAASLQLNASAGSIGTGADPIETQTGLMAANAGGSIFLRNTGALTIGDTPFAGFTSHSPSGFPAAFAFGGSSDLTAGGTVVLVNDGGLVVEAGTVVNPGLGASAASGNLLLQDLSGSITLRSDLSVPAGSVTVLAATGISVESSLVNGGSTYDLQAQGGDLSFQSGLTLATIGANVRLQASGDVVLANVNAGAGQVHVQAGDDIRMAGAGHTVTADQARFIAVDAVGDLAGNAPIDTTVTTVAASAGAGGIHLRDANAIIVGQTGLYGVNRVDTLGGTSALTDGPLSGHTTTANGSIVQRNTSGNLTVASAVSANGAGNIRLAAGAGGSVLVNNTVNSGTGNITVFAQGLVNQSISGAIGTGGTGTIDVEAAGGNVTLGSTLAAGSGNVRVDASGAVFLGTVTTTGNASIEAGTSITDSNGAAVNVTATQVRLNAQGGTVGTGADRIETATSSLAARGGAGGVFLENTGNVITDNVAPVTVNRVGPTAATTALADAATLNGISTTVNGSAVLVNNGSVTVAGSGIQANGAGNILVQENTGNVTLDGPALTGSGAISVIAAGRVNQNVSLTTSGNTIDVQAVGGDIVQDAAAMTSTSGGNIRYRAGGAITVASLDAGAGNVSLEALGGAVAEDGDAGVDVVANALRVEGSGAGVQTTNPFDTDVNTLAASVGAGGLNVQNVDALTIGTVAPVSVNRVQLDGTALPNVSGANLVGVTGSGNDIEVSTQDGNLTVANAVSNTSANPDDKVFLHAQGADRVLQVNAPVSATAGDVVLRASGNVNVTQNVTGGRNVAVWADDNANNVGDVNQPSGTISAGTLNVFIAGENFTQGAAGQINALNGGVTVNVNSDVNLGSLLTGITALNLAVGANNIIVDTVVHVDETAVLRARTGNILHTGGNPAARIEAVSLGLAAAQDIGQSGNRLRVDTDFLSMAADNIFVQELGSTTAINGTLLITNPGFYPPTGPDCADLIPRPFVDEAEMIALFTGLTGADVVDIDVIGDLTTGGLLTAGSTLLLTVGGNLDLDSIIVGGDADIAVNGWMNVRNVQIGNNLTLGVGGFYHGDVADVGGNLDANIGAETQLNVLNVAGNAVVVTGGDFAVDEADVNGNASIDSGADATGTSLDVGGDLALTTRGDVTYDSVDVTRNASIDAGGRMVGNDLTVGGNLDAAIGRDFLIGDVSVGGNADLNVGGTAEGSTLGVRGALDAVIRGNLFYDDIEVGRTAFLDVGGDIEGDTLDVGSDLEIIGGGDLVFTSLTSGDAEIDVDGSVDIDTIDTGSLDLAAGGSLTFEEINASGVNARIGGQVRMAKVNGGGQATFRAGSIVDAGSMVRAGRVSLSASGDVGSSGRKINVDTSNIPLLSGNNVFVNNIRGGETVLGLLEARNRAELCVGGSIVDGNGDDVNVVAGSALLQTTGTIGTARDPIDIAIERTLSLAGGQEIPGILWGFFRGDLGQPPIRYGGPDAFAPGIAVLNSTVSLINPELNAILLSAESYGDDLVGFKFRNSVFGDFYFLHLYLQVSELADDLDLNYIDYILYGRALVTPDPELPPAARNPIYIGGDEGN